MLKLHQWQSQFLQSLYAHKLDVMHEVFDDFTSHPTRLSIYRDTLFFGLIEILNQAFDVTCTVLGKPAFDIVARDYIYANPQTCGDRNRYGVTFPSYLSRDSRLVHLPYLSDLAALEWVMNQAHHADDADALGFEQIMTTAHIGLHPSAQILNTNYNVFELYQAHMNNVVEGFSLICAPHTYLIWRNGDDEVICATLTDAQMRFVNRLMARDGLICIIESLADSEIAPLQAFLAKTVTAQLYVNLP